MTTTEQLTGRMRVLMVSLIVLGIAAVLVPAGATAATVNDPASYAPTAQPCTGSTGAGGRDASGAMYMRCGAKIRKITRAGVISEATYPAGVWSIVPSPDGTYLYALRFDRDGAGFWTFMRLRLTNGAWVKDHTGFAPPKIGGRELCGRDLATDHYGYIYVSNGGWCLGHQNRIVKLRANGQLVTQFGDFGNRVGNDPRSAPGLFNTNMGIAVTPDGRRIYVADHLNTRVQYFDWTWNGGYVYGGAWHVPSATYGVELDPWGNVHATSTTQGDVFEYSPTGVLQRVVANRTSVIHEISIDGNGSVYSNEQAQKYVRPGAIPALPATPAEPRVDTRDPLITAFTVPAETTDAAVTVTLAATDPDGNAITHMRLADEQGEWQAWRAFSTRFTVTLSAGLGTKAVFVQVRDAAGRESLVTSRQIVRRPVPDNAAPIISVQAPTTLIAQWRVALTITGSDDVGITHIRIAGDDGTFGEWMPWSNGTRQLTHELAAGYGARVIFVQARDAAWHVSETARITIAVVAPPVVQPAPAPGGGGAAPAPAPGPVAGGGAGAAAMTRARDRVRPRIRSARIAARTCTRRVTLRIRATDDRRVTHMRIANEDGRWGRWIRYRSTHRHLLSRGATYKLVTVQVRDSAGNVSRSVSRRSRVTRC